MLFRSPTKPSVKDSIVQDDCLHHNFEAGDHVLRWTNLLFYPIQVHGIVFTAGVGIVTIIDFGLSSRNEHPLEEMQHNDRDRRLNIITLTEQKEVDQWKKVNYGESLLSDGKWAKIVSWFRRNENSSLVSEDKVLSQKDMARVKKIDLEDDYQDRLDIPHVKLSSYDGVAMPPLDEAFARQKEAEEILWWLEEEESGDNVDKDTNTSDLVRSQHNEEIKIFPTFKASESFGNLSSGRQVKISKKTSKSSGPPSLPKSDPPNIVLSRVRFLLSDEGKGVLPPHHLLFANSECIAVWCKTGRFSTIQSQVFLHSTALGNAKTATTVALMVSTQTVTVTSTIPAAGLWGWLGYTTTTTSQVGLLSMNPWLIPVLAGYGIAAVGTPYFILHQAQGKWEKATSELNDAFWQRASHDVFIDAIHHWSGLVP